MKKLFFAVINWLARLYLNIHKPYIIGITGSVWKTSCRMVIAQTLTTLLPGLRIATSQKNFNSIDAWFALAIFDVNEFTPSLVGSCKALAHVLGRFFQRKRYDILVLEYGIDQPGDMTGLIAIARPDIAIFTALDKVHAMNFANKDDILFEKTRLLVAARDVVFYPSDGEYILPFLAHIDVEKLSYSMQEDVSHEADIGYKDYLLTYINDSVQAVFSLMQGREKIGTACIPVLGKEQAAYTSIAVAIQLILARRFQQAWVTNISNEEDVWTLLLPLSLQEGRATVLHWIHNSMIIDSSYNAAPESMKIMIDTSILLRDQVFPASELILCLGDMRELWIYTESEHRALAQYVAHRTDRLYLVGECMQRYLLDELKLLWFSSHRVSWFANSHLLWNALREHLMQSPTPAVVLCKWSQNTIFLEESVKAILHDPRDASRLCRQSTRRMQRKEAYFTTQ